MKLTKAELEGELRLLKERVRTLEREAEHRRRAEFEFRGLVDQLPCLVWTTDHELRFTSSVGAAVENLKIPHQQIVGLTLFEYFGTEDTCFLPINASLQALEGQQTRYMNVWQERHFMVSVAPLRSSRRKITGTIGIALDITEQCRAELAFHESEHRYRDLFENANDLLYTYDLEGALTSVNAAGERTFGYKRAALIGRNIADLLIPECRDSVILHIHSLLGGGALQGCELTGLTSSGSRVLLEVDQRLVMRNGQPVGVHAVARDVTERKAMEEQMRQAQKMEAIGVLAGGVAHDFNNLLTGILGYAYLLQNEPEVVEHHQDAVGVIIKSAERAAQLTSQLLGFARRGKAQNVPVDIHAVVRDVVELLHRTIDKQILITTETNALQSHVLGDPNQLYQLLLNLCLNAKDAMPGGGEMRISTKGTASSLVLSVKDTGTGIPAEIRERIYEPFFTTKEKNKGTGMGLAMVYGIAKNHGGTVYAESEVGRGSSFHITLPVCESGDSQAAPRIEPQPGNGRILVIDDEDVVRQVLSKMLRGLGYEVVTAGDSCQAVEFYRTHYQEIDLVILDMIMPKMTGRACYSAMREVNPKLRAVLATGYTRDGDANDLLKHGSVEFLQKPFQIEQLSTIVKRALSRRSAHNA